MASASVPPPPEDDSLLDPLLFSQLEGTQQQHRVDNGLFSDGYDSQYHQQHHYGGHTQFASSNYFKPQMMYSEAQPSSSSWGAPGDGFAGALVGPEEPQTVPYTPSLERSRASNSRGTHHLMTAERRLNFSFDAPEEPSGRGNIALRPVTEIPEKYRSVFKEFPFFNLVQSKVFDDVLYTDLPLVISAPTGSGKTVVFELAIIRLLQQTGQQISSIKIVYVAPMKALCSERFSDWQTKFGPLGLRCCELTGDSQLDDYFELQSAQIVMTTPEKWDSMTRRWRDHKSLVQLVRLFLIDEVHQLNDEVRGPTVEAIVSRMKTIRAASDHTASGGGGGGGGGGRGGGGGGGGATTGLRLIAVSATIPNICDLCSWLGSEENPALEYKIDECHRPVRLRKVVLGYPTSSSDFKFNLSLNYRLSGVIHTYSDQKPCLVFCATRKGTQQAAATLVKDARFIMNSEHKQRLNTLATGLRDGKLRDLVLCGVGYHHAGMDISDRKTIEGMFTSGDLPVLISTSTLAMGVNLPAHLVVVKSTSHYVQGMFQEYTESQILQMIGRAGRPQFDTTATAVIMTSHANKSKYESLLGGKQLIESCLHHNLIEHLNAEIVLHTISDVSIALEWLHSTFFYIRVKQNPKFYNFPEQKEKLESKLQELLVKDLNLLAKHSLISMEDGFLLQPTDTGRLMARYCVAFKSMQRFLDLSGREELQEIVGVVSQCQEFADIHLRVAEKRVLNTLNKDKNKLTIRFPMEGKIKSKDMKINCLMQATLGSLPVQEFSLNQDTQKIFRSASRLSKCLLELRMLGDEFHSLLNSVILHKCIQARLWENSKHVARQLDKIGVTISTTLVNAGLTTFDKIHDINPRELELIVNRHPPFGTQIRDAVARLPKYAVTLEQSGVHTSHQADLVVTISLTNHTLLSNPSSTTSSSSGPTLGPGHTSMLLVGDGTNHILCKQRIRDSQLLGSGQFSRKLTVRRVPESDEVHVHYISLEYVGLDVREAFTPHYTGPKPLLPKAKENNYSFAVKERGVGGGKEGGREGGRLTGQSQRRPCNHRCINKAVCGHDCCRNGLAVKKPVRSKPNATNTATPALGSKPHLPANQHQGSTPSSVGMRRKRGMESFLDDLHARRNSLPDTPALKRIKPVLSTPYQTASGSSSSSSSSSSSYLPNLREQYSYTPSNVERMLPRQHQNQYGSKLGNYRPSGSQLMDDIYEGRQQERGNERRERIGPSFLPTRHSTVDHTHQFMEETSQRKMADFEEYIWDEGKEGDTTSSERVPDMGTGGQGINTSSKIDTSILITRGTSSLPQPKRKSPLLLPSFDPHPLSSNSVPPLLPPLPPPRHQLLPTAVSSDHSTLYSDPINPRKPTIPPANIQKTTSSSSTSYSSSSFFFTRRPDTGVEEEEEDDSDLYGSVFHGIF